MGGTHRPPTEGVRREQGRQRPTEAPQKGRSRSWSRVYQTTFCPHQPAGRPDQTPLSPHQTAARGDQTAAEWRQTVGGGCQTAVRGCPAAAACHQTAPRTRQTPGWVGQTAARHGQTGGVNAPGTARKKLAGFWIDRGGACFEIRANLPGPAGGHTGRGLIRSNHKPPNQMKEYWEITHERGVETL